MPLVRPQPALPIWSSLLLMAACGDPPPLAFSARQIPVGHDQATVHDAVPFDLDRDGDIDLMVATALGLRFLRQDDGRWRDGTLGTGLEELAPATRLHDLGGGDVLVERPGAPPTLLVHTGIGSWDETPAEQALAPAPHTTPLDLDGDDLPDRARLDGRQVRVERGLPGDGWQDVSEVVGTLALRLPEAGRRLRAVDVEGDGDTDLLVVGGRLFLMIGNGGPWVAPPSIGAGVAPAGAPAPAPAGGSTPARDAAPGQASGTSHSGDGPTAPARTTPAPWFTDATEAAGLAFVHREGDEQWDIRPTMGPGAAWEDVDADGDEDLLVVGGAGQSCALFLNDGEARFRDAAADWGLGPVGSGMGAVFADVDDDGDSDLYVTADGPNALFRHDGDRFTEVGREAGVDDGRWGAGAALADVDNDGDLDLYVTNYLEFDTSLIPAESERAGQRREDPIAMLPYVFPGQPNLLYRNRGDGRFDEVTEAAGLLAPDGKSLGALFVDHDADGWQDLYVANDTTPNTFWHNLGEGRFEEIALFVGLDDPRGGMGLDGGDVDRDGDQDLLLTNWQLEPNALYRNNHVHAPTARRFMPRFEDVAVPSGLARESVGYVGWGCLLADLDDDGDLDLAVANGYTSPDYETTMVCVGQRDQLLENVTTVDLAAEHRAIPSWRLVPPEEAGPAFARALPSRGLAAADADGDGDLDLAVTTNNGPLVFLRNERGGRSLRVVPEGRAPRDPAGAVVELTLDDGSRLTAVVRRGQSYLSGHARGVRFGLGPRRATGLSVLWPDGTRSTHPVDGPSPLRPRQP